MTTITGKPMSRLPKPAGEGGGGELRGARGRGRGRESKEMVWDGGWVGGAEVTGNEVGGVKVHTRCSAAAGRCGRVEALAILG